MPFNEETRGRAIKSALNMPEYWVGLSTTAVNPNGTGATEPSPLTGYARVKSINNTTNWSEPTDGEIHNLTQIKFNTFIADAGVATHCFIAATSTGLPQISSKFVDASGNPNPRPLSADATLFLNPNDLSFSAKNPTSI